MTRILAAAAVLVAAVGAIAWTAHGEVPPKEAEQEAKKKAVDPGELKLPTRRDVMEIKLKSSQVILEGIALKDFDKLLSASESLVTVCDATEFLNAYKGAEYQFHMLMFRRAADALVAKSKDKNIDGVMVAYQDMTLSCLKCHEAMRDNRFEVKAAPPPGTNGG